MTFPSTRSPLTCLTDRTTVSPSRDIDARIAIEELIMRELNYGIRMLNYPHVT